MIEKNFLLIYLLYLFFKKIKLRQGSKNFTSGFPKFMSGVFIYL